MSKELSEMELATLTNIGKNVKFVRRDLLHLTLNELSDMTGVSRDVICRLEALSDGKGSAGFGRVYPSISTVIKFCEGVGVTPGELMDTDFQQSMNIKEKIVESCADVGNVIPGMKAIPASNVGQDASISLE